MMIEARQQPAQFLLDPSLDERSAIGLRGQREAVGYAVAEQRAQFAKRCGLAADGRRRPCSRISSNQRTWSLAAIRGLLLPSASSRTMLPPDSAAPR